MPSCPWNMFIEHVKVITKEIKSFEPSTNIRHLPPFNDHLLWRSSSKQNGSHTPEKHTADSVKKVGVDVWLTLRDRSPENKVSKEK